MTIRPILIPAFSAGIIFFAVANGRAESYRNNAHHFTLELPAGWEPMPPGFLAAANASGRGIPGPISDFVAGFRRTASPGIGSPIILVQIEPRRNEGQSFDELERELSKDFGKTVKKVERTWSEAGLRSSISDVLIDRAAKRIVMRIRGNDVGADPVVGHGIGLIGREAIVFLNCYALEAESEQWLPTFNAIADSVRFDAGFNFVPRSSDGEGIPLVAIAGLIVIVVAAGWLTLRRLGWINRQRPI